MTAPTPPPVPPLPPSGAYAPLWRDQRKIDAEHLRLLAIFHYVLGGLCVLGTGFLVMHYLMFSTFFTNPKIWQNPNMHGTPPPPEFFAMFKWFYVFFGAVLVVVLALNVVSGWCIARRRARNFSLVIAGLDCLWVPFGTVLGVFTLVVLLRDSVRDAYAVSPGVGNLPG